MSSPRTIISRLVSNATSMGASITSPVIDVRDWDDIALELVATGTPTGTVAVQGALDYDPNQPVAFPGSWVALSLTPSPAYTGSADNILIDMATVSMPFLRVVYTRSSGTGALTIYAAGKGLY